MCVCVGVSSLFFIHPELLEPEKDLGAVVVIASSRSIRVTVCHPDWPDYPPPPGRLSDQKQKKKKKKVKKKTDRSMELDVGSV